MTDKWVRDITAQDFKDWMLKFCKTANEYDWEELFEAFEPTILELESEDYFGTEGFDKRFG